MNTRAGHELNSRQPKRKRTLSLLPLLLCALVMAIALLSYYIQVINEQVQRGEQLRQAQRAAPTSYGFAGQGHAPALEPARQQLVRTTVAR